MEKIIETKTCRCGTKFNITDKDLEFYDKVSPVFGGVKYLIPVPTLCPDCRQQRRLSFRNERKLYKRKCDLTGKDIISIYSPDKPYKVYEQSEWWSDKWNPTDYGRDFNFSRGFFEQFEELVKETPLLSLIIINSENSEYNNYSANLKNCYLNFNTMELDSTGYNYETSFGNNIFDCSYSKKLNECYECLVCHSSYNLYYSQNCYSCNNSCYLFDCKNCSNCIGCFNLVNKEFHIFNKKYSQEEYLKEKNRLLNNPKLIIEKLKGIKNSMIVVDFNKLSENCTGYNLVNCKNMQSSFDNIDSQNGKFVFNSNKIQDSYDYDGGAGPSELCLELNGTLDCYNCLFDILSSGNSIMYSQDCFYNKNCFGCVGLKNKEYCILNKQYTKEEYEELVPKIIEHMKSAGEWGEFFPSSISPFGYNETVASEYFPMSRNEALSKGFKWSDYEAPFPKVSKTIPASKLPDDISSIPDDILNWAIECEVSGKPFRIIKQELEFYRKHGLPIPRRHPDVRHMDRMKLRNPRKLYDRKCDKCSIDIKTTYSPDRPEIVYCEECYNKEIL